jgi:adenosylcobinamide-GDP ribazoletransferase
MQFLKQESIYFFTALQFFTRLPVPSGLPYSEEILNQSSRYFVWVGFIVGAIGIITYQVSSWIFPMPLAIILSMISTILTTGAFHEDGFADVCDGFGGGWTKEKILLIMKDSRLGTYGVIGIFLMLVTKFFCLSAFFEQHFSPFLFISAHVLSRWTAVIFLYRDDYARENDTLSKSKPLAKRMSFSAFLFSSISALFFFSILPCLDQQVQKIMPLYYILPILAVLGVYFYLRRYFYRWINGFTGDCLGATQQIAEIVFYLVFWIAFRLG